MSLCPLRVLSQSYFLGWGGDCEIVPFGKLGVEHDGQGGVEGGGDLAPGLVDPTEDVDGGCEAGQGKITCSPSP